jgi:cadmium resistance protein CadD (predicted permease)
VGVAIVAFASTNVDDLVLLTTWFADRRSNTLQVVVGQFLGIGVLVALSLAGATAALLVPVEWLRWLGLVPVAIGVRKLMSGDHANGPAAGPGSSVLPVAAVTFANGGDNIGVYVPLFASLDRWHLALTVLVFAGMTAVWCALSLALVRNPLFGRAVAVGGSRIAPWVLILIGLSIAFRGFTGGGD